MGLGLISLRITLSTNARGTLRSPTHCGSRDRCLWSPSEPRNSPSSSDLHCSNQPFSLHHAPKQFLIVLRSLMAVQHPLRLLFNPFHHAGSIQPGHHQALTVHHPLSVRPGECPHALRRSRDLQEVRRRHTGERAQAVGVVGLRVSQVGVCV